MCVCVEVGLSHLAVRGVGGDYAQQLCDAGPAVVRVDVGVDVGAVLCVRRRRRRQRRHLVLRRAHRRPRHPLPALPCRRTQVITRLYSPALRQS